MKNRRLALARLRNVAVLLAAIVVACGKSTTPTSPKTSDSSYEFWTQNPSGTGVGTYYVLSGSCYRGYRVTGKLFMVTKVDATGAVQDCEIGMSSVTQTPMSLPAGEMAFREPTLDASAIDYHDRLGLTGTVALLVSWSTPYDQFKSSMTPSTGSDGLPLFSFRQGNSPGGVRYNEYWVFKINAKNAHDATNVGGYVVNTDQTYCLGRDSDASSSPLQFVKKH